MAASNLERRRLAIARALREVMAEADPSQPSEPDDGVGQRATVPPLERAEAMSAHASRALFGHH